VANEVEVVDVFGSVLVGDLAVTLVVLVFAGTVVVVVVVDVEAPGVASRAA